MLLVFLGICIVLVIGGVFLYDEFDFEVISGISVVAGISIGIIDLIIIMTTFFCYPYRVNEKIKMYQEENIKIEEKVKNTIRVYMKYEQDTYENLIKDNDLTTLLIAYPDLNSNELVKSEIELYIDNNKKLKELKEDKIIRPVYRFWLYLGK